MINALIIDQTIIEENQYVIMSCHAFSLSTYKDGSFDDVTNIKLDAQ